MSQALLDGVSLHYEEAGSGEPVVFIHGACIADAFRPLFDQPDLASRYRLIAYRRRGYAGSSRAGGKLSLEEQASDCLALLRHLNVPRAHVVGHSFGGAVALEMAMAAPDAVHSLALLEPALMIGRSAEGYRDSLRGVIERFRTVGGEIAVDEMLNARWPGYRPHLDAAIPGAFELAVADAWTTFEAELPGLLEWRFGPEEAKKIGQPVLSVIGGESESLSPRFGEAHRWLLDTLARAEPYVLPRTHHLHQVENPEDLARALAGFFSRHSLQGLPSRHGGTR